MVSWTPPQTDASALSGKRITKDDLKADISDNIEWLRERNRLVSIVSTSLNTGTDTPILTVNYRSKSGGYALIEVFFMIDYITGATNMTYKLNRNGVEKLRILHQTNGVVAKRYNHSFYYIDDEISQAGEAMTYTVTVSDNNAAIPVAVQRRIEITDIGRGATRYG